MRIAACVIGMLGGFFGIYFGLLLVTSTALLGLLTSAFGGTSADPSGPFLFGLLALFLYTVGVSGGVVALVRPGIAALLMLATAVGGLAATIAIGPATASLFPQARASAAPPTARPTAFITLVPRSPAPTAPTSSFEPGATAWLVVSFPFAGPALLVVGAVLAGLAARGSVRGARPATTTAVMARRGEISSYGPVPLLSAPAPSALSAFGDVPAKVQFDVLNQHGDYVHVRGPGFEGYLPASRIRLL